MQGNSTRSVSTDESVIKLDVARKRKSPGSRNRRNVSEGGTKKKEKKKRKKEKIIATARARTFFKDDRIFL